MWLQGFGILPPHERHDRRRKRNNLKTLQREVLRRYVGLGEEHVERVDVVLAEQMLKVTDAEAIRKVTETFNKVPAEDLQGKIEKPSAYLQKVFNNVVSTGG